MLNWQQRQLLPEKRGWISYLALKVGSACFTLCRGGARLRDMFPRGSVEEEVGKKRERNDCIEIT